MMNEARYLAPKGSAYVHAANLPRPLRGNSRRAGDDLDEPPDCTSARSAPRATACAREGFRVALCLQGVMHRCRVIFGSGARNSAT
jgi:hypothetical protein